MKGAARKKKEPLEETVMVRMTTLDRRAGLLLATDLGYDESELWRRLLGQKTGSETLTNETNMLRKRYELLRAKLRRMRQP